MQFSLNNTYKLVNKILNITLPPNAKLLSFDVKSQKINPVILSEMIFLLEKTLLYF